MKTRRRFFSTSTWLIGFYCLATILYLCWATIPIRARPQLAGTIPETNTATPTKTPRPTRTPTATRTPTVTATSIAASTGTATATPTNTTVGAETATATQTPIGTSIAPSTATDTATPTNTTVGAETATATQTPIPTQTPTPTGIAITPLTPTPTVAPVILTFTKTDFLFSDEDQNNLVSPGDKLLYAITLINTGETPAQQVRLEDTLDPNTTLLGGTLKTTKGTISQGNNSGDLQVVIDIAKLAPGERATISLQVILKAQINDTQVQNQAIVTFANEVDGLSEREILISDDPDTSQTLDSTITPLNGHQPRPSSKLFLPLVAHK